jgi:hypothetical protein
MKQFQLTIEHKAPLLEVEESYLLCFELLNEEIFLKKLSLNITEPKTSIKTIFKAKPKIKGAIPTRAQYMDVFEKQK